MKHLRSVRAWMARWWANVVVRLAVGTLVSVVFFVLALRAVPVGEVWRTLAQANILFVVLTLVSIAVNTVVKAVRWKVLLGTDGREIGVWELLGPILVGQMLNTFIPTRLGDLSRAYAIGRRGLGVPFVLGTVVVEKLLDMIAFGLLVLLSLLLVPLPDWVAGPARRVLVMGVLVVVTIVLVSRGRFLARLIAWFQARFQHRLVTKIVEAMRAAFASGSVLGQPTAAAQLIVLSALVWGTALLNNYLVLLALRIDVPVGAALLLLVGLLLGISLPSLPGTIGVYEYICVVVLALFAVERGIALSYGILLHALVLIPSTIVGLLFLIRPGTTWRPPAAVAQGSDSSPHTP